MKHLIIIAISWLASTMSAADSLKIIDTFVMDYPHGENRIMSNASGEAFLFYGAMSKTQVLEVGIFFADDLYEQFQPYLEENLPREKRSNPDGIYGMITIAYRDGSESSHIIVDREELTDAVFERARMHIAYERAF